MRRVYLIGTCCVVLVLVPIYFWEVMGWQIPGLNSSTPVENIVPPPPDDLHTTGLLDSTQMEHLAQTDPVALLRQSQAHYQAQHITGYTCVLTKRERVHGKLREREVIEAWFQENPFSVLMVWKEGKDQAAASLYAVNEKKDKMFVRPANHLAARLTGFVERHPDSSEAKASTRYFITEFGIQHGTERTRKAWEKIQERGLMKFAYRGIQKCAEAGNRDCYVVTRFCDPKTEEDINEREEGLTEVTIYIDTETWLQVGTVLKAKDQLIGEYYFRDIQLNPKFGPMQFKPETLKKF